MRSSERARFTGCSKEEPLPANRSLRFRCRKCGGNAEAVRTVADNRKLGDNESQIEDHVRVLDASDRPIRPVAESWCGRLPASSKTVLETADLNHGSADCGDRGRRPWRFP